MGIGPDTARTPSSTCDGELPALIRCVKIIFNSGRVFTKRAVAEPPAAARDAVSMLIMVQTGKLVKIFT